MRVTRIAAREIDAPLACRWTALQSHPGHPEWLHPFLSAAFAQLTAEIRVHARVAVIEDAGSIVGLWAFEEPLPGLAHPLARHMSDLQGVLLDPQWADDQMGSAQWGSAERGFAESPLRSVARQLRLPLVRVDHLLPSRQAPMASRRIRWMIALHEGFDAYRREQSPRTRWWRRAPGKARKLAEAMGPLTWRDDVRDDEAWTALARWKSAQYRASGLRDNFAIGWVREWLERLRWADSPGLRGSLQSLRAGGQVVAVHFGMRGHHILHHYLPAYDSALSDQSPGSVLLEQTISQAPAQGVTMIDLSTGDMDYKQSVSNRQEFLERGSIGPGVLLRLEALAHRTADGLRGWPGLLPVARLGRRALVSVINGPARPQG